MSNERPDQLSRRAWLSLTGAAALAGCSAPAPVRAPIAPGPKSLADKPNFIVFLADSLRARELGVYGCEWPTSPVLDDLARQGIVYERCLAPCSWTKPSVGSIFTGLVPTAHQTILNTFGVALAERKSHELRPAFTTMAESLRMAGYHTFWSLENPLVQTHLGYGQGFEKQDYGWPPDPAGQVDRMIQWIQAGLPEPFLLFIHEMDPHVPYLPDEALVRELFGTTREDILAAIDPEQAALVNDFDAHLRRMQLDPSRVTEEVRPDVDNLISAEGAQAWRHLYAAETLGVDRLFGKLLDALDSAGHLDSSYVLFTGDHGEAFREHGNIMHGHTLYEEEVHVPLVVRPPGGSSPTRVPEPVSLLDLYPTFCTLGGAPMPGYLHGAPLLDGGGSLLDQSGRMIVSETNRFRDDPKLWHMTAHRGGLKVYLHDMGARAEGFDLTTDPLETQNLLEGAGNAGLQQLAADLKTAHAAHTELAAALGPAAWIGWDTNANDDGVFEDIESVGYL